MPLARRNMAMDYWPNTSKAEDLYFSRIMCSINKLINTLPE